LFCHILYAKDASFQLKQKRNKKVDGARESGDVLTEDGPFDSPGHYEKYCTYTPLYVDSNVT